MRYHALRALYVILVLAGCSQTPTLSQISNEHGFQRLQAPQRVLEPGTLITFDESSEGLTALTPVCWRHQAFPALRPAQRVSGAELNLRGQLGDWHSLDPAYLKNLQTKFPEVEDIQLRLRNASILENSDTELYKGLSTRSQPCQDAIAAREANGETVYTTLKVLHADVTYKVIGVKRSRLVGKLPQKTLERLKTELGGLSVDTFNQTIEGATLQVAFQSDIIDLASQPTPLAEAEGVPTIEAKSMSSTEDGAILDTESGKFHRISRLTEAQRQSLIQKMAILSKGTSDADRLQR